jgi:high affinity Mn2+ porin
MCSFEHQPQAWESCCGLSQVALCCNPSSGRAGIVVGHGALTYDGERILEAYYKYTIADGVHISADYQFVDNPGYNLVRGPVSLFALRFHADF